MFHSFSEPVTKNSDGSKPVRMSVYIYVVD